MHTLNRNDSNINIESPIYKFIVDNILHKMRTLYLTKVQTDIAQSIICEIILIGAINVLLSLYIISLGTINNERISKIFKIRCKSGAIYLFMVYALKCIC